MSWAQRLEPMWQRLLAHAPTVALVIAVVLVGLLLSSVARRVFRWLTRKSGLEALAERAGIAKMLYAMGAKKGLAELVGTIAWVAGVLLTFSAVADLLRLQAVAAITTLAVRYLPKLLAAAAVMVGGMALATLVQRVLSAFGQARDDVEAPHFLARLAYYAILTVTLTLAADQAGLQTGIINALILVVVGISLAGLSLSFALGARGVFHNLAARHYYERILRTGDHVRVGDHDGVVVRFSPVAVVLRSARGREVVIPCGELMGRAVVVENVAGPTSSARGDDDSHADDD